MNWEGRYHGAGEIENFYQESKQSIRQRWHQPSGPPGTKALQELNRVELVTDNLKFQLLFDDRIGIVSDIAGLMARQQLNIVTMEVEQQGNFAQVSLEIEKTDKVDVESLHGLFSSLPGIKSKRVMRLLPREKRQNWFRTLFDGMSEGIISIDEQGFINTINAVACHILGQVYDDVIGHHISELSPKDSILLECIEKRRPVSRRKMIVTDTGRVEFYGAAKLINDYEGNLVGAVLLMKDLREVKEMVDAVSAPLPLTFDDVIGRSPTIRNLITFARKIATTDAIVSITGESGTGKEFFAKALHYESGRTGPFIPINCAALPEALIESELFGHVDGAFTGARAKGKPGLFEAAGDGTIFLDEIGDMPLGTQAKILRVLQEGFIRRIGGVKEIPVNARVITATNKKLWAMIQENKFREDLFYRINVFNILIPPLRERLPDLPLLATTFLHQFNRKLSKADQTITQEAMAKLYNHSWPGNVRELKNVIERASVLSDSEAIGVEAILFAHETSSQVGPSEKHAGNHGNGRPLKEQVSSYEIAILLDTLNATPSIREAARQLGLSHTALLKKVKKYQLYNAAKSNKWCNADKDEISLSG